MKGELATKQHKINKSLCAFCAFLWLTLLVDVGFNGNFGRNVLIGPRLTDADLALLKSVKFAEDKTVQVRAEVFNVANHPNFGLPGGAVFSQGAVAGTGNVNPTYGRITSTRTTSRQVQLGFKFIF